jgi:hypothetical protein
MLNGKDYRRDTLADGLARRVDEINRQPPLANISLKLDPRQPGVLLVQGVASVPATTRQDSATYLALYENNLATAVAAGENRGKKLHHDFVVRDLAGPYPIRPGEKVPFDRSYRIDAGWKVTDLHVAAFVQNERTGDVLQALALRNCMQ